MSEKYENEIYRDEFVRVEFEKSEVPWVKIFAVKAFREISDTDEQTRARLFAAALACEKALREFYRPTKINWASFANYVPQVHIHVQARFEDDSFFPESLWGKKQREGAKRELKLEEFGRFLAANLKKELK